MIGHRAQAFGRDCIPAFEFATKMRDRLHARGDAGAPQVERGLFERRERCERRRRLVDGHRAPEFAARFAFVEPAQRPHRFAPRGEPGCERARGGEIFQRVLTETGARRKLVEAGKRRAGECCFEPLALPFTQPAHHVKAQTRRTLGIDETPIFARIDGHRLDHHAVPPRVVDQHLGRIETHRLHVEDRGQKDGRLVALHVRRRIR